MHRPSYVLQGAKCEHGNALRRQLKQGGQPSGARDAAKSGFAGDMAPGASIKSLLVGSRTRMEASPRTGSRAAQAG